MSLHIYWLISHALSLIGSVYVIVNVQFALHSEISVWKEGIHVFGWMTLDLIK